jgi:hypothetical protein
MPNPIHTSAPTSAVTRVKSQSGQVKFQNRKWSVTSSVFWNMKMMRTANPESEAIAPPLSPLADPFGGPLMLFGPCWTMTPPPMCPGAGPAKGPYIRSDDERKM